MEATATATDPVAARLCVVGNGIEVSIGDDPPALLDRAMVLVFATEAEVRRALADGVVRITGFPATK